VQFKTVGNKDIYYILFLMPITVGTANIFF
jgi:hypothetical protein